MTTSTNLWFSSTERSPGTIPLQHDLNSEVLEKNYCYLRPKEDFYNFYTSVFLHHQSKFIRNMVYSYSFLTILFPGRVEAVEKLRVNTWFIVTKPVVVRGTSNHQVFWHYLGCLRISNHCSIGTITSCCAKRTQMPLRPHLFGGRDGQHTSLLCWCMSWIMN